MTRETNAHQYFNSNPSGYAAKYTDKTAEGYAFRVRRESLLHLLGQGNNGRVLDIGCGPGVMTKEIIARGWSYEGTDVAPGMIATAQSRFAREARAHFRVGSVYTLHFPNNYFDVVVAMGVTEYLDNESAALTEMRRVLKQGGRLIISLPNWWSPARMWDRWILTPLAKTIRSLLRQEPSAKLFHREYDLRTYCQFLEQRGFAVSRWQSYNYRVIPRPLDFWLPRLAIATAKFLENSRNRFWWIGTSLNVEAEKRI